MINTDDLFPKRVKAQARRRFRDMLPGKFLGIFSHSDKVVDKTLTPSPWTTPMDYTYGTTLK